MTKKHLGTITILVSDRQKNSASLNKLLTNKSVIILARMGINIQPKCAGDCLGLVTLAVEGTAKEINGLAKAVNSLYGVKADAVIITN